MSSVGGEGAISENSPILEDNEDAGLQLLSVKLDLLNYEIQSLSIRYPRMESDEKFRLAKQVVYEAFKRHIESTNRAGVRRFTWLVTQCELIEADDTPEYFRPRCSLFLPQGSITIQALRAGWGTWENFNLLRQRASIEAMCEMQTILSLSTPCH